MNGEDDVNLTYIWFCHYKNISSCYLHKHLLPEHGNTCPSFMNIEDLETGKDTTWKVLYWDHAAFWIFIQNIKFQELNNWLSFATCLHPWKTYCAVKWHDMFWVNTVILTENTHAIMQKDVRYLVRKFNHNTSLVVSPFILGKFRLSTWTNWNHPLYLWHNFILAYLLKVVRMLALLRQISPFFFNYFLQNKWYLYSWQPCGITQTVAQRSVIVHKLFMYYRFLL